MSRKKYEYQILASDQKDWIGLHLPTVSNLYELACGVHSGDDLCSIAANAAQFYLVRALTGKKLFL